MQLKDKDSRIDKISEIKKLDLPIFIWGGAETARKIVDYLRENGILKQITYVVDDEYYFEGNQVIPLSEFLAKYATTSIMVFGFYNYGEICKKKEMYGSQIPYLYDFHITFVNGKRVAWNTDVFLENVDKYYETYEMLSDLKSQKVLESYLNAAVYGDFDNLYVNNREEVAYFNSITKDYKVECLVDCGAYDGDSIHDFVAVFQDYKKIYAIEPDPKNIDSLKKRIENEKIRDVNVISKGVYKETTTLHFSSDGSSASYMSKEGDISIQVIAMDELLKNEEENLLIKMDIEGSELDALVGLSRTIITKRPALAVCVYHKEEDLFKIPQYIDSLVEKGDYDFYLRYHGVDLAELVFYCIPR